MKDIRQKFAPAKRFMMAHEHFDCNFPYSSIKEALFTNNRKIILLRFNTRTISHCNRITVFTK